MFDWSFRATVRIAAGVVASAVILAFVAGFLLARL